MHDDREAETEDLLEARISGFLSYASMCSFYNAAGQIDGDLRRSLFLYAAAGIPFITPHLLACR